MRDREIVQWKRGLRTAAFKKRRVFLKRTVALLLIIGLLLFHIYLEYAAHGLRPLLTQIELGVIVFLGLAMFINGALHFRSNRFE